MFRFGTRAWVTSCRTLSWLSRPCHGALPPHQQNTSVLVVTCGVLEPTCEPTKQLQGEDKYTTSFIRPYLVSTCTSKTFLYKPCLLTFTYIFDLSAPFGAFSGLNFIAARPRAIKSKNQLVPSNEK